MKKIFFAIGFLLPFLYACGQSTIGRLPYQVLIMTYAGDTLLFFLDEDTVQISTDQNFFDFNKPIRVNGDIVGSSGVVGDTIEFSDGSKILVDAANKTIKLFPYNSESEYIKTWHHDGEPIIESYAFKLAPLDTTANDTIGAIKFKDSDKKFYGYNGTDWDLLTGGGSGSGTIEGTIADEQIAYGSGSDEIQGTDSLTYDGDTLTNTGVTILDGNVHLPDLASADSSFVWVSLTGKILRVDREEVPSWIFNEKWKFRNDVRFWKQYKDLQLVYMDSLGVIHKPGTLLKPFSPSDQQLQAEIEKNYLYDNKLRHQVICLWGMVGCLFLIIIGILLRVDKFKKR